MNIIVKVLFNLEAINQYKKKIKKKIRKKNLIQESLEHNKRMICF